MALNMDTSSVLHLQLARPRVSPIKIWHICCTFLFPHSMFIILKPALMPLQATNNKHTIIKYDKQRGNEVAHSLNVSYIHVIPNVPAFTNKNNKTAIYKYYTRVIIRLVSGRRLIPQISIVNLGLNGVIMMYFTIIQSFYLYKKLVNPRINVNSPTWNGTLVSHF